MYRWMALAIAMVVAQAGASPCNAPYYIQGGAEYVRVLSMTSSEDVVSSDSADLDPYMNGITIIDTNIAYSFVREFDGECGMPVDDNVVLWNRAAGSSSSFGEVQSPNLYTEMFDSSAVKLGASGFDWWYAIGPDTANLHVVVNSAQYVVGRRGDGDSFTTWYGSASLVDSTQQSSGLWQVAMSYFPWYAYYDSSALANNLLQTWRATEWNDSNRRGKITLQLVKVTYDTTWDSSAVILREPIAAALHGILLVGDARVDVFDPLGRTVGRVPRGVEAVLPRAAGLYIVQVRTRDGALQLPRVQTAR